MKCNRMSLKKSNTISSAWKSAASNQFIVFGFYDTLEKVMSEKQFLSLQIWNLDESGFPTDPGRCKVIAPKGKVANKITSGAGHENITVLAACNALVKAIDPLVIFTGKNFQSSWKRKSPLPNTMYGVSDNGWMNTQLFHQWFEKFCSQVTERSLLIIHDGYLSHMLILLIEKAREEDTTILKLPPHVTDKIQPLDVLCFGPLRRAWTELLN